MGPSAMWGGLGLRKTRTRGGEKLLHTGPAALGDTELLALIESRGIVEGLLLEEIIDVAPKQQKPAG